MDVPILSREHAAFCDDCGAFVGWFSTPEVAAPEVERHKRPHDGLGCRSDRDDGHVGAM